MFAWSSIASPTSPKPFVQIAGSILELTLVEHLNIFDGGLRDRMQRVSHECE